jgi:cystathionine beta-lyase/cystathionine gamma-synthase
MTGLEINSQTVLINTPTNVTLPNSDVVGVTWNTTENGVIVVIEEELG